MTHLDAGHPKCASIKLSNIIRWLNYREACAPKFVMCGNHDVENVKGNRLPGDADGSIFARQNPGPFACDQSRRAAIV